MAKIRPMISLALKAGEDPFPGAVIESTTSGKPRYPYGTRISFEDAQLKAIGLDPADCAVGGVLHIHGLARITSVSLNEHEGGETSRVELQIEEMCCAESEDAENDEAEGIMARRRKLYGGRDK